MKQYRPQKMTEAQLLEHVLSLGVREGACLLWPYANCPYAQVWFQRKTIRISRLICASRIGCSVFDLKTQEEAMHTCDVPNCIEPTHLVLGTPSQNRLDCIAKGRAPYLDRILHVRS